MNEIELTDFVTQILALVFHFPGSITSWVRTPAHNALVGGVPGSAHLRGLAVDVVFDNTPSEIDVRAFLGRNSGIKMIRETTHDHFEMEG